MNLKKNLRNKLALGLLILAPFAAGAVPIEIEADHKQLDYQSGKGIYEGHVVVRQGRLEIRADTLKLDQNSKHMVLLGQPVTLHHVDEAGVVTDAQARQVDYYGQEKKVVLTGKAELKQEGDSLSSEHIEYWTDSKRIEAGDMSGTSRVHMVIESEETP